MIVFFLLAFVGSIAADENLFRAIEAESPKLFNSLGRPNWFATMWNPVVVVKVISLLIMPSSFESGSYLHKKLWVSRLANIIFTISIFLMMT